ARMPTVAPRPVPRPPVLKPIVPAPEAVRPVAHAEPEAGEPSTQSHSLNPGEVGSAVEDASTNSAELDRLLVDTADEFEVLIPQEHGLVQRFVALFAGVRDRLNRNVAVEADMDSINQIQIQFEGIQQEKAALQSEVTVLNELLSHADQEAEEQGDVLEAQRQIAATAKARADHLAGELAKLSQMHGVSVNWESENKVQAFDPTALPTPSSVGEFFAQLDKLQHVRFSGDRKYAERITDLKLRGLILRDAWRYACELEKYAIAQKKDGGPGNLRAYVAEFTTQITHNEFAPDETKKLKETQKFYQPRMLPVPTSVDPAGKVFMGAHFRLSQDNGKAMRMHVHDATKQDGIVYIGYIGQHLPSSKTS
ncbi:MAG: hypothetical protein J0H64_07955, partial [Actinobacteria bacterium]|nr:hypothetical protein [Actinomycetota bacterium]